MNSPFAASYFSAFSKNTLMKDNSLKTENVFSPRSPCLREIKFRISVKTILICAICVLSGHQLFAANEVEAEGRAAGDQRTASREAMFNRMHGRQIIVHEVVGYRPTTTRFITSTRLKHS